MPARDRSKRKYGFGDHSAPTKRECLELVEKEKGVGSARLVNLMEIKLNYASRFFIVANRKLRYPSNLSLQPQCSSSNSHLLQSNTKHHL